MAKTIFTLSPELKAKQTELHFTCRFHPHEGWHTVGCTHQEWTAEDYASAYFTMKEFQDKRIAGMILDANTKDEILGKDTK